MIRAPFHRALTRDRRGGVTLILAGSLFMLAGAATVAVDLGSVYLARRQLQGVADAAALAAADGGRSAAEQLIDQSGVNGIALATLDTGSYAADPTVPVEQRFRANDPTGGAMRVELRRRTPLFFGRLLVGRDGIDLSARATAARSDAAAFSLGTMLVTGEGQARSPLMSITAKRDVVLRTAQTRLYLESTVATALSGIASVRIPLYIELAAAEARLSDIQCGEAGGVTLAVTPSVGVAALGDIDMNALTNFSVPASPRATVLAQALGTRVTGYANIALGGTQTHNVHFSPAEIGAQQAKTVGTQDLTQGIAASLAGQTQVQVSLLGLTVSNSPLTPLVGALLGTTAPLLDGIINSVTATLGVRVGSAEVRVHQRRCGMASIVA